MHAPYIIHATGDNEYYYNLFQRHASIPNAEIERERATMEMSVLTLRPIKCWYTGWLAGCETVALRSLVHPIFGGGQREDNEHLKTNVHCWNPLHKPTGGWSNFAGKLHAVCTIWEHGALPGEGREVEINFTLQFTHMAKTHIHLHHTLACI